MMLRKLIRSKEINESWSKYIFIGFFIFENIWGFISVSLMKKYIRFTFDRYRKYLNKKFFINFNK